MMIKVWSLSVGWGGGVGPEVNFRIAIIINIRDCIVVMLIRAYRHGLCYVYMYIYKGINIFIYIDV